MPKRRIKHNDLLPWFTMDHGQLPAAYLKSCKEFFDWLDRCKREGFQAPKPASPQALTGCKLDKSSGKM